MATLERSEAMTAPAVPAWGWLRSPSFDLLFIAGIMLAALVSAGVVVLRPALFTVVVVADMWLLGFHHVVSTFTRLTFDSESFRNYRFLVVWLPLIVLAGVIGLITVIGHWVVPTVYLYWQWFHYTRQSYGIAQIYRRKAGPLGDEPALLTKATIYLLPLWGILQRSYQKPETFLGMEIKVLPVPLLLVQAVAACALLALGLWVVRQAIAWKQGRLPVAYTLYMLSHLTIFAFGYLLIDSLDYGWLAINVWHNAQYILLVWMFNNNRFKGGVDPEHRFLSTISQKNKLVVYFLVCLGISTLIYAGLDVTLKSLGLPLLTVTLIAYQTLNFHHYIVDGIIWKVRRQRLQANLGLPPA